MRSSAVLPAGGDARLPFINPSERSFPTELGFAEGALIGMYRARYRASIWPARHPFIAAFSLWTSPPSPYCPFFEIVRKAAEFIGNIRKHAERAHADNQPLRAGILIDFLA